MFGAKSVVELILRGKDEASGAFDAVSGKIGGLGGMLGTGLAVGAGAAIAAVGAVGAVAWNMAGDVQAATTSVQAQFGMTADEAERVGDIATNVWGNNFAGSIEEAAGVVGLIRQQFGDLSDNELQAATESAFALTDVFDVSAPEAVSAATTLMENFGLSSEQAFDFLAGGFQNGLDRSGDFLDTINEYSTQFSSGGASADQFFSLLDSGLQGGMLGTDKAADAFKEFRVRIQDGSDLTADALEAIGFNATEMADLFEDGSADAAWAFQVVLDALNDVDDENLRMQAGVALLGTQFEDLGTEAALGLSMTGTSMDDLAGSTDSLNAKYDTLGAVMGGAWRQLQTALVPAGEAMTGVASEIMPLVVGAVEAVVPHLVTMGEWLGENIPAAMEAVSGWWSGTLQPALAQFSGLLSGELGPGLGAVGVALGEALPLAISILSGFWNDYLQPVFHALWTLLSGTVIPILGDLFDWLGEQLPVAIDFLQNAWDNVLQPAVAAAGEFMSETLIPLLGDLFVWIAENLPPALQTLADFWNEILHPALVTVWEYLDENIIPIFESAWTWLQENLPGAIETAKEVFTTAWESIKGAVSGAWDVIGNIFEKIQAFGDWLQTHVFNFSFNIPTLPDWMIPGSPIPLHTAWENFADFLQTADFSPQMKTGSGSMVGIGMPTIPTPLLPVGGGGGNTINIYVQDAETGRQLLALVDELRRDSIITVR